MPEYVSTNIRKLTPPFKFDVLKNVYYITKTKKQLCTARSFREDIMNRFLLASFISLTTFQPVMAAEQIYELEVQTDSNWTSIEIRDDATFVNAPPGQSMNVTAKDGIKSYTISPKKVHLRSRTRGDVSMNLFVKSQNNVLGVNICKGSSNSYTFIKSKQAKQKNDVKEKDYCETAALVLQLF